MIENESLAFKESFIHRINPSIRLLCAVILSFWVALISSFEDFSFLSGCFLLSVIFVLSGGISFQEIYRRLKPLFLFLLMIWIILPLSFNGTPVFSIFFFDVSQQGLEYCAMISIKSITIILFFMAFVASMTIGVMGYAMQKLYIPEKFIFLILMTYRYIFVIVEEYQRLLRAAKIRGFVSKTTIHSYRTYAYIAAMLFVRASMRAKRVHQAMICRGFDGTFHAIDKFAFDRFSIIFLIVVLGFMSLYQWLYCIF